MYGEKDVWKTKATDDAPTNKEQPTPKETSKNMVISTLYTLLDLNIAADFFKAENLRDAVNKEIDILLRHEWCAHIFGVVAGVVATRVSDEALQKLLCQIAADHIEDLSAKSIDLGGLMKLDGATREFMHACASRFEKTTNQLKTQLDLVTSQLKTKSDVAEAKDKAWTEALKNSEEMTAGVNKLIDSLGRQHECYNCGEDRGWDIETNDYKTYSLFCRECDRNKDSG